jgi:hypothetical protein
MVSLIFPGKFQHSFSDQAKAAFSPHVFSNQFNNNLNIQRYIHIEVREALYVSLPVKHISFCRITETIQLN